MVFDATNSSGASSALVDTTLPREIVEQYVAHLPAASLGFLNGYGPSFTARPAAANTGGNPSFLSFDYYLDEQRPAAAIAADLRNRPGPPTGD